MPDMNAPNNRLVFVYGTLKSGFHNNRLLTSNKAECLGIAWTVDKCRLWAHGFPMIKVANEDEPESGHVMGEVWKVNDYCVADLDRLEDEGGMYRRIGLMVQNGAGQVLADTYIWNQPTDGIRKVLPNAEGFINWTGRSR